MIFFNISEAKNRPVVCATDKYKYKLPLNCELSAIFMCHVKYVHAQPAANHTFTHLVHTPSHFWDQLFLQIGTYFFLNDFFPVPNHMC